MTMKFLYTNTELNLPYHLSYVAAREIVDFLCLETPYFIPPDLCHPNIADLNPVNYKNWVIMQHHDYQTKICSVDEQRVIDIWCGFEQLTINMAIDQA